MSKSVLQAVNTFKILSDPTRLKILLILFHMKKDLCVNEISKAVRISHSATSHQLAKLESRGIVRCFRVGRTMCYKINNSSLTKNVQKALLPFN